MTRRSVGGKALEKAVPAAGKPRRRHVSEAEIRRRQNILAAARKLVTNNGYENFTMHDLAAESGVALGTLYNYYAGKEDIVGASYEEHHGVVFARLERDEAHRGLDRLFLIIDQVAAEIASNSRYIREIITKYPLNSYSAATRLARSRAYRRSLEEMQADGSLPESVDLEPLASHLTEALQLPLVGWAQGRVPEELVAPYARYIVCLALDGMTVGPIHERLLQLVVDLGRQLTAPRS